MVNEVDLRKDDGSWIQYWMNSIICTMQVERRHKLGKMTEKQIVLHEL